MILNPDWLPSNRLLFSVALISSPFVCHFCFHFTLDLALTFLLFTHSCLLSKRLTWRLQALRLWCSSTTSPVLLYPPSTSADGGDLLCAVGRPLWLTLWDDRSLRSCRFLYAYYKGISYMRYVACIRVSHYIFGGILRRRISSSGKKFVLPRVFTLSPVPVTRGGLGAALREAQQSSLRSSAGISEPHGVFTDWWRRPTRWLHPVRALFHSSEAWRALLSLPNPPQAVSSNSRGPSSPLTFCSLQFNRASRCARRCCSYMLFMRSISYFPFTTRSWKGAPCRAFFLRVMLMLLLRLLLKAICCKILIKMKKYDPYYTSKSCI